MKSIELFVSLSSPELEVIPYSMKNGCYSAVTPDQPSKTKLINLARTLGFTKFDPEKLHVTLMYSESPITNAKVASAEFPAICKEVSYWTGHDGKTYVVAKLSGDALFNEHERLKGLGAKHSFDEYSPHVTLDASEGELSDKLKTAIDEVNASLGRYPMNLMFADQFIGDLKD
jgi:2'-5' RNA ligase